MDREWMARQLPEEPPTGLVSWAIDKHGEKELGGEFLIFSSERVRLDDGRWEWAAFCTCTACQEEFCTQKEPGEKAIRMILGEDGSYYTVDPGTDVDPYMGIEINRQWDELYCPICGSKVTLLHKSTIKGGRTKRMMVVAVQDVQGYAALVYWMVERHLTEYGISNYIAKPEEDCMPIGTMDAQRESKKSIFGGGLLLSDKAAAERAAAERAAAERAAAHVWQLSEREKTRVAAMRGGGYKRTQNKDTRSGEDRAFAA